jgi:hypothetical protein
MLTVEELNDSSSTLPLLRISAMAITPRYAASLPMP